jgi:hypothetical protein
LIDHGENMTTKPVKGGAGQGGEEAAPHARQEAHAAGEAEREDGQAIRLGKAGTAVKGGMIERIVDVQRIEGDLVQLVRTSVSDALRASGAAAGDMSEVMRDVVAGAIGAVEQVGTGLALCMKALAKGAIMGVHDTGGDVIAASFEIPRALVRHSAAAGGDVGTVARRAIDGIIEASADTGADVAHIAGNAASGAIKGAGEIGGLAVTTVRDVLISLAGGVGHVVVATLPQGQPGRHAEPEAEAGKVPPHQRH